MKVFQINTVCGYGSTGRIVSDLATFISSQGEKCEIAYGRDNHDTKYNNTYYIGSSLDHNLHGLFSRVTDRQGFYSKSATLKLCNHIQRYDPDIIHLHNLHGYYINIPILFDFLKVIDKPVIWTLHDCWPFTGHCTYFDTVACNKWVNKCYNCVQKQEYPTSYVFDSSEVNFTQKRMLFTSIKKLHIVTPSRWLHNLVKQSFLSSCDARVIYNGIDMNLFRPYKSNFKQNHGLNDKNVLLGVASIWGERKGLQDFIELSNLIDERFAIVLVGLNDNQIKTLPKNIVGIKRTNNIKELCEIYSAADYYLNLTYQDNFPTTNIEALACGIPVITYNTGGSIEAVDGTCGIVIDKKEYNAITCLQPGKFKKEDCIKRAKQFEKISQYSKYYSTYLEVLGE